MVESPRVCYTLSLWENAEAIRDFNSLHIHTHAANWGIRQVYQRKLHRAELWSTQWTLSAVSYNLRWDDFNLGEVIARAAACCVDDSTKD